jgi:hypothetical protein
VTSGFGQLVENMSMEQIFAHYTEIVNDNALEASMMDKKPVVYPYSNKKISTE